MSSCWQLLREADRRGLADLQEMVDELDRLQAAEKILRVWDFDALADANELLEMVGKEAIEAALVTPEVVEPSVEWTPIREVLEQCATDEVKAVPANADTKLLLQLAQSANRVREELFWQDYLDQVDHTFLVTMQKWQAGEVDDRVAKAVTGLLMVLKKLTATVEHRAKQALASEHNERAAAAWRERASSRR